MALTNSDTYETFLRINDEKVLMVKVAYNEDTELFPYKIVFVDGDDVWTADDSLQNE